MSLYQFKRRHRKDKAVELASRVLAAGFVVATWWVFRTLFFDKP